MAAAGREPLSLNAALFRIEKTDARTAEPGSLEQTLDGKQRSQGFEIEAVGRLLPNWNLFAGYTYLDTKVLESKDVQGGIPVQGKRLIAAPEHSFTLWTTYDITTQWQVGGGVDLREPARGQRQQHEHAARLRQGRRHRRVLSRRRTPSCA